MPTHRPQQLVGQQGLARPTPPNQGKPEAMPSRPSTSRRHRSSSNSDGSPASSKRDPPHIFGRLGTALDHLSLAICAYIGGWWVYRRTAPLVPVSSISSTALHFEAIVAALMTAFGGGSIYVLIRVFSSKRSDGLGAASFAWYQHSCQLAAAVGWLLSVPIGHPADTHSIPNSLFQMLDCVNNGILVAWAVSKISVDGCGGIPKLLWFPAIFCYCAGGGTVRDLLLGNPWQLPGNLQLEVVIPMGLACALYSLLLWICAQIPVVPAAASTYLGVPMIAFVFCAVGPLCGDNGFFGRPHFLWIPISLVLLLSVNVFPPMNQRRHEYKQL